MAREAEERAAAVAEFTQAERRLLAAQKRAEWEAARDDRRKFEKRQRRSERALPCSPE